MIMVIEDCECGCAVSPEKQIRRSGIHLSVRTLIQNRNAVKSSETKFNIQTRNINKIIKRQHDACINIQLPGEVEHQLRFLFKQHSNKKLLEKNAIDVVHINDIRKVCIAAATNIFLSGSGCFVCARLRSVCPWHVFHDV